MAKIDEARATYPALIAYIEDRNTLETSGDWCDKLAEDRAAAEAGAFADMAADLARADADYGQYPYNSAMGLFLGLPLKADTNEPAHGYYMARSIASSHAYGVAKREADRLIASGASLRVVAARKKGTGKPCRFHVFTGPDQIRLEGCSADLSNGKVRCRLYSNWSYETLAQKVLTALSSGAAYGETA